jgi:3'(2'), 5'-bisphosphate nucleotidase
MLEFDRPTLQFALQAALQASLLVRQVQAELAAAALTKEDRSPVTVADFAAQALVAGMLGEAFPEDTLVAEETAHALRKPEAEATLRQVSGYVGRFWPGAGPDQVCAWIDRGDGAPQGRYWVLDPIDGTKGFLRGGQYAVALALMEAGQVQLGVLGCPNLEGSRREATTGAGSLVAAQRGRGAWTGALTPAPAGGAFSHDLFRPLRVSPQGDPAEARLLRSFEKAHTNTQIIDALAAQLGVRRQPLRLDSQAKYALLAAGSGEIIIRLPPEKDPGYQEKIWDQAAGALIVEEAGGRISDLTGKPLDFTCGRTLQRNRGVLATNGRLHERVLAELAALLP